MLALTRTQKLSAAERALIRETAAELTAKSIALRSSLLLNGKLQIKALETELAIADLRRESESELDADAVAKLSALERLTPLIAQKQATAEKTGIAARKSLSNVVDGAGLAIGQLCDGFTAQLRQQIEAALAPFYADWQPPHVGDQPAVAALRTFLNPQHTTTGVGAESLLTIAEQRLAILGEIEAGKFAWSYEGWTAKADDETEQDAAQVGAA